MWMEEVPGCHLHLCHHPPVVMRMELLIGRFFQSSEPPRSDCHCLPLTPNDQWQSNLGGDENWKNRTSYRNGERSMLIDINGDGLPDRVFDHNPEADDQLMSISLEVRLWMEEVPGCSHDPPVVMRMELLIGRFFQLPLPQ
jgi:hypothetical protein